MNTDIATQYVEREIRLAKNKGAAYVFFDMTDPIIREMVLFYSPYPIEVNTKTFYLSLNPRHVLQYTSTRVVQIVLDQLVNYVNAPPIQTHIVCLAPLKKPIKHIKRINNEDR